MSASEPSDARTLRRGGLALIGVVAQGLTRFLTALAVGHAAGPAALGQFTSAQSLANFLSVCWPTTSGSAAAKFVARAEGGGSAQGAAAALGFIRRRVFEMIILLVLSIIGVVALDGRDLRGFTGSGSPDGGASASTPCAVVLCSLGRSTDGQQSSMSCVARWPSAVWWSSSCWDSPDRHFSSHWRLVSQAT